MSAPANKIFSLIPLIMSEIGAIAKTGVNTDDGYSFRAIDDICDRIQPLLAKHKIFTVPSVQSSSEERESKGKHKGTVRVKLKVKYTVCAEDGSFIESIVESEAIDDSDKATNKAMTAAYKTMLTQVFCLRSGETAEGDSTTPKLTFVDEKQTPPRKKITPRKVKPIGGDMKVPEGKFKGKMLSTIPAHELSEYIQDIDAAMKSSGMKAPKWFEQLRRVSGL